VNVPRALHSRPCAEYNKYKHDRALWKGIEFARYCLHINGTPELNYAFWKIVFRAATQRLIMIIFDSVLGVAARLLINALLLAVDPDILF
jgi:hypothetical protein